jgi:rhodanese-related sulfurtransferase
MNYKTNVLQIIIILFISVLCGLTYNALSDSGISLIYEPLNLQSGAILTIEQTARLLNEGQTLFIDTRYKDEFELGHLKNAKNLPANATRDQIMSFFENIPKEQQIVTYCSSPDCNSSRRLAGFLTYLGYTKVFIYVEGFEEWRVKDYPIER